MQRRVLFEGRLGSWLVLGVLEGGIVIKVRGRRGRKSLKSEYIWIVN